MYKRQLKKHFLAQNRVIWRIKRKNRPKNEQKNQKSVVNFEQKGCIFYLYGQQKPLGGLGPNFLVVGVHDVITPFKFGDDRLRGFGLAVISKFGLRPTVIPTVALSA